MSYANRLRLQCEGQAPFSTWTESAASPLQMPKMVTVSYLQMGHPMDVVTINRAPVLTLWAAVVAECLGFDHDEALTLGKAVAGLTAQSKGQRLGIFTPSPEAVRKERAKKAKAAGVLRVALLGRAVPVLRTDFGLRAVERSRNR